MPLFAFDDESQNLHSTNANFDHLRHITTKQRTLFTDVELTVGFWGT